MPSCRRLLAGSAALVSAGLAGCNADTRLSGTPTDTPTETPIPYPNTRAEPLHLGPDFDLELPPGVTLVDDPADATVTLLAGRGGLVTGGRPCGRRHCGARGGDDGAIAGRG